jgi:hypothetical protein
MFNRDTLSDTTILIQNITLPTHEIVIGLQSPYLAGAIEKALITTGSRTLVFQEGSGMAHWRVFEYLYTGAYTDRGDGSTPDGMSVETNLI